MSRKRALSLQLLLMVVFLALISLLASDAQKSAPVASLLGQLATGAKVFGSPNSDGTWGLALEGAGMASVRQPWPAQVEVSDGTPGVASIRSGYQSLDKDPKGFHGTAKLSISGGVFLTVVDQWSIEGNVLRIARRLTISGNGQGGFVSAMTFVTERAAARADVDVFAPGNIYGSTKGLRDTALGGAAVYRDGKGTVRIREDRLPAPLYGVRFNDGSSMTVLDSSPRGGTISVDAQDTKPELVIDERMQFGALGSEDSGGRMAVGYWFPGIEGEYTYRGPIWPFQEGQVHQWRLRYHPLKDGLVQTYEVSFRFAQGESFPDYYANAWRWAWQTLKPPVVKHDIDAVRRHIVDMLAGQVETIDGRTGIPNAIFWEGEKITKRDRKAVLGFTGKNLESANFMLMESDRDPTARGARLRKLALAIIDSFLKLKMSPPAGEGFNLDTGEPVMAIAEHKRIYLRSFGDDVKIMLKAYLRERRLGRDHPDWLRWSKEFGDWLLPQQQAEGGFPRSWKPGTGEVVDASPNSSYNAVPLLVLLSEATGDRKYLGAAIRAGEFVWGFGGANGVFVGGTIDNPDVIDKEAGTLSLEAYLALHEATRDRKWLERAVRAANYAETWIFLWNVPMAVDDDDAKLEWKRGVSTVGLQLIATGHSLVDEYMSFDVDEYARMYSLSKDSHYLDVARVLLHSTKSMVALPGRQYDLPGPGWQQEHWGLAPKRGFGLVRLWLPWVATSQLNGIFGLEEFDPKLYKQLAEGN
jgi:hypothetical protein